MRWNKCMHWIIVIFIKDNLKISQAYRGLTWKQKTKKER